ncbi:MAG TPA: DUF58 domain-containing protein [Bacteroidetes bacterium]|nr:DUF58 domain-containing protein [Bacteroidota bacterium]
MILTPETVAQLGSMELRARLVVEGFITGLHKSPFHGFSAEFSEHRQYRRGDELKHIDWKIYGRSNRFYVKQFEDETNLRAMICVDMSASMSYSSEGHVSKYRYATFLAASLSYLIMHQRDAAGLALYNTDVQAFMPPRSKMTYAQELMRTLEEARPAAQTGTGISLHHIAERLSRRGLVVIISDLLDDPETILSGLRHFRHDQHDVMVFHVMDPREVDLGFDASTVFRDLETGQEITTQPLQIRGAYRQAVEDYTTTLKRGCHALNVDYVRITTDMPFDVALREYLVKRASRSW